MHRLCNLPIFGAFTHRSLKACASAAKLPEEYCVISGSPVQDRHPYTGANPAGQQQGTWCWSTNCVLEADLFNLNYFVILSFSLPSFSFSVTSTCHPGKPTDFTPLLQMSPGSDLTSPVSRCGLRQCFCTLKSQTRFLYLQRSSFKRP